MDLDRGDRQPHACLAGRVRVYLVEQWMGVEGNRHQIPGIWPVNFWGERLSQKALGLSSHQVVARLAATVARAAVLNDGAFIVVDEGTPSWCSLQARAKAVLERLRDAWPPPI